MLFGIIIVFIGLLLSYAYSVMVGMFLVVVGGAVFFKAYTYEKPEYVMKDYSGGATTYTLTSSPGSRR